METNPLSIILVKSDSKGDRLLFRYPFVTDTRSDIGLHSRRKNPYALTVTEDLLQTPPPQTSNIHNGNLTGFSDEVLSTLFAVKPELCNEKFELKVNDVRFVGHPTLLHSASCIGNQDNPSIILINIVFALQATASHSIVKCYHVLSRRLGISLRHEENRCAYLSKETRTMVTAHDEAVAARPCDPHSWKSDGERGPPEGGQGTLRADLPESPFELILQRSGLARDLKSVHENLRSTGLVHLQVNDAIEVSFCLPQRVHRGISDGGGGPPVEPEAVERCLRALRPYHALILLVGKGELKGWLPPRAAPALARLLAHHSPRKSLHRLTIDTGLTIAQVYQLVGLMVYWAKAMVVFPLCRNNLYAIAPGAPTAPSKVPSLTSAFSEQFPGHGLLATVSRFSPPTTLGHFLLSPSLPPPPRPIPQPCAAHTIAAVVWLLRHRFLMQLHTYVHFVPSQRGDLPTVEEPQSPSVRFSSGELRFGDDGDEPQKVEEPGKVSNGNSSSDDVSVDAKEGNLEEKSEKDVEEPLTKAGLSAEERAAVVSILAASCQEDLTLFARLVEYMIVKFDDKNKTARLSLRGAEILEKLNSEYTSQSVEEEARCLWHPEYAAYMLEATPAQPYGGLLAHFNVVEANMKYRREQAGKLMHLGEKLMTLTSFPRLGCPEFSDPVSKPDPVSGLSSKSLFFPDEAIFPGHPRFKTLTRNIRQRRGEKVVINLPIFKDVQTLSPFVEDYSALGDDGEGQRAALPDHVYLDAMGFGMGCCCLQLTFQACNINEARTLYDQLAPLCPIMLALTAASPFHRGLITDVDCRWNIISGAVDCRTQAERGLKPLGPGERFIPKSRYDSITSYLSPQGEKFNDVPLVFDEAAFQQLSKAGIDPLLARHIAHLFIRDSVSLFSERVHQDDSEDSDHFENIQSTNWQTMRFKPPPPNSPIGWRVEFRPCEVQITDFENAALVCFVVLLTRVILSYQLDFIIPISKVDDNMQKAQKRNAIQNQKFWFRKDITTSVSPPEVTCQCPIFLSDSSSKSSSSSCDVYVPMTINEIVNGKEGEFPGLIPLITSYLSGMDVDADTHCTVQQYLKLIQRRASGDLMTTAQWLRKFVTTHPDYRKNSVISEKINYDLLKTIDSIQNGIIPCPDLLGAPLISKTQDAVPQTISKAECLNEEC